MPAPKLALPNWAYEYRAPSHQKGDFGASFYEDEGGGTISVYVERHDGELFGLNMDRGGMSEGRFTARELRRVAELITILTAAATGPK